MFKYMTTLLLGICVGLVVQADTNLDKLLSQYNRPFTMIELGEGDHSFEAARAYPDSTCIMVSDDKKILERCKKSALNNIMLFNRDLRVDEAQRLSECEHFDVVIASNILHRFGKDWKQITDIILNMGDNIIIETSTDSRSSENEQLKKEMSSYLLQKNAQVLEGAFHISTKKELLRRKTWIIPLLPEKTHFVKSNFDKKELHKSIRSCHESTEYHVSDWKPGINLITFKMLHGVYPTADMLKDALTAIREDTHSDWLANNIVLQGNKIELIDFDDPRFGGPSRRVRAPEESYQNHLRLMDMDDPEQIKYFFFNYACWFPIQNRFCDELLNSVLKCGDLVFDIGASKGENTQRYTSLGAKVVSVDGCAYKEYFLTREFISNPQVSIIRKNITDKVCDGKKETTLKELMDEHGKPDYCAFNIKNTSMLLELNEPIKHLSFRFAMKDFADIQQCMDHLKSLGYKHFNFSCRQIPKYMLNEWSDNKTMFDELQERVEKDHDPENLWGFIYARFDAH